VGICENVQFLCKKNNLPTSHLEKELALANGSIRRWNESSPSIDKVQKVADYFKVSTDYLLYGFDKTLLVQLVNYVRDNRTHDQFAEDTEVDTNELTKICMGITLEPPSLSTIERIAANNPVDYLVSRTDLLQAAGYLDENTTQKINEEGIKKYRAKREDHDIETLAAHRDGKEWTEEELADIERFKEFIRMKRNAKS